MAPMHSMLNMCLIVICGTIMCIKQDEIIMMKGCFNHRAIATFIEVLAFLY